MVSLPRAADKAAGAREQSNAERLSADTRLSLYAALSRSIAGFGLLTALENLQRAIPLPAKVFWRKQCRDDFDQLC